MKFSLLHSYSFLLFSYSYPSLVIFVVAIKLTFQFLCALKRLIGRFFLIHPQFILRKNGLLHRWAWINFFFSLLFSFLLFFCHLIFCFIIVFVWWSAYRIPLLGLCASWTLSWFSHNLSCTPHAFDRFTACVFCSYIFYL